MLITSTLSFGLFFTVFYRYFVEGAHDLCHHCAISHSKTLGNNDGNDGVNGDRIRDDIDYFTVHFLVQGLVADGLHDNSYGEDVGARATVHFIGHRKTH